MNTSALTFALSAGLVAALNPCGFALLPGYLALVITGNAEAPSRLVAVGRAGVATVAMAAGFVTVFGLFGLVIAPLTNSIEAVLPYVTLGVGIVLLALGIWLLLGREVRLFMPTLSIGSPTASLASMYGYGLTYAVASLSCTVAPFLAVISMTFHDGSIALGTLAFVVYGLGMAVTVGVAALAVALLGTSAAGALRKVLPYVSRAAGVIVTIAALYVAYYGYYEIRVASGSDARDPIVGAVVGVQGWFAERVAAIGVWPLVGAIAVIAVVAAALTPLARKKRAGEHVGGETP